MTDIRDLLDRASGTDATVAVPVADDLARAHRALRRRRTRRTGLAAASVLAVVGAGYGVSAALDDATAPDAPPLAIQGAPSGQSELVRANVKVGPFTLRKLPRDWEVRRLTGGMVAVVPPGSSKNEDQLDLTEALLLRPLADVSSKRERDALDAALRRLGRSEADFISVITTGWASLADAAAGPGIFTSVPKDSDTELWEDVLNSTRGLRTIDDCLVVFDLPPRDENAQCVDDRSKTPAPEAPIVAPAERGFQLDPLPAGWELQASNSHGLVLAPADGSAGDNPDVFAGKVVVGLDANNLLRNPGPNLTPTDFNGRTFYSWDDGGDGALQVAVPTRDGEPDGDLRIQAPLDAFTVQQLVELLDRITVTANAAATVG